MDVSQLKNFDTDELLQGKPVTFTKQQYCCGIALIILTIGLIIPGVCPKGWAVVQFLTSLNTVGWGLLVLVVMLWIQVDGKPLMDLPAAARTGVNWEVIFFFAMIMYIPGILTHPDTGLRGFW